jgi:preprotein translocase subunit SecD
MIVAATAKPGKQIAIVVNGTVVSAPLVSSRISQRFRVSGSLDKSDWEDLVQ